MRKFKLACNLEASGRLERAGVSEDMGLESEILSRSPRLESSVYYYMKNLPAKQHIPRNTCRIFLHRIYLRYKACIYLKIMGIIRPFLIYRVSYKDS